MWNRKLIAVITCLGLLAVTILGTITYVQAEGSANANVINAAPTILSQEILDATYTTTVTMIPDATFYLNILDEQKATASLDETDWKKENSSVPSPVCGILPTINSNR